MIGIHGNPIAAVGKMAGQSVEAGADRAVRHLIDRDYYSCLDFMIDLVVVRRYGPPHIRPLAVRPLNYPESVPNPWGFSFSGLQYRSARGETVWVCARRASTCESAWISPA